MIQREWPERKCNYYCISLSVIQGPTTVTKTGERYYDCTREVLEASDVAYIDGKLYNFFKSLRYAQGPIVCMHAL